MKIKKRGNLLVAFAEQGDNEGRTKVGDKLGQISLKTGKFTGNTCSMLKLQEEYNKINPESRKQKLVDEVIKELKKSLEMGDETTLDELLHMIPVSNLVQSLPEERWKEFPEVKVKGLALN